MTDTFKPLIETLKGKRIDPPPIWLMRQAGRYLPEYRAIREEAGGFLDLCYSPEKAAEVTLQPLRRFGFDAAILFSDILVIPHALGQDVSFDAGHGPRLDPIRSVSELRHLSKDKLHESLQPIYETVGIVSEDLPNGAALIGFSGAPWTVATYMIEGKSSRDFKISKRWALGDPNSFQILIDLLIESTAEYLVRQVEAGAEVLQIFDTWAGVLPKFAYDRFCFKPICEIVRRVKRIHPRVPFIAFPRGAALYLPDLAQNPEIDCVGIDYSTDPGWAANNIQPFATVQGNIDPISLLAGGHELERGVHSVIKALSGGPHILNLGHGIVPETPTANVEKLVKVVRG